MRKIIAAACVLALLICILSGCGEASQAREVVRDYFTALNEMDFMTAGECLGDPSIYLTVIDDLDPAGGSTLYDRVQATYFVTFVYTNLKWKCLSVRQTEEGFTARVRIESYSVEEITQKVETAQRELMEKPEYAKADDEKKYLMLINNIPEIYMTLSRELEKKTSTVELQIARSGESLYIVPSQRLFDAIGGVL
ncbi:MAG: hypothetical protein J5822_04120 [Eubacteriaceae bacterium]|nr:hypothetical protein [Eubacteriaceae bacterium]